MINAIKWACPKCEATANAHGKGGRDKCEDHMASAAACGGFLCECEDETADDHGSSFADPCPNAQCYHCGWEGSFPKLPSKMPPWAKKALSEGWTAPKGWTP